MVDCDANETTAQLTKTLSEVSDTGTAQCRFCEYMAEGDSFGEIFEDLAEHGEAEHEWDTGTGWSE